MSAGELFKAGRLREAIEAQVLEVKAQPGDAARRLFLFELHAFNGDLERARKQIDAIAVEPAEHQLAVATYASLLDAEAKRRGVFRQGSAPKFLTVPPAHVHDRLEALARLQAGDAAEADALLEKANADLPALRGSLNGQAFEGLRDVDDLFGTVIEVMAQGEYFWVPLEQVESLTMGAPRFPRDLLWFPARLELAGTAGDVFVSALYPSSHEHTDEHVRLGRMTDWTAPEVRPTQGAGLHTFLAGDDPSGILEWRELILARGAETPAEDGS
jgi:type VI secretion system protein ImpE